MKKMIIGLSCSCSLLALAYAAPAAALDDQQTVTEIVVTANKREERLQDVPASVTAVGADQLARQNITSTDDLVRAVPGLGVAPVPSGGMAVRGIGTRTFSRSAEGSVGIVVDNVALGNAVNPQSPVQLFDVSRVEVLAGPQGTLFGKNTSAGVLNITTKSPVLGVFEGAGHADIGTRNSRVLQGVVNLPLGDDAALRVSGHLDQLPQVYENVFKGRRNDNDAKGVRTRLRWEPSADLSINLIADYDKSRQRDSTWAISNSTPGSFLTQQLAKCGIVASHTNNRACLDGPADSTFESYGASAQVDYDLGGYTLSSITANRWLITRNQADSDSVQVNLLNSNFGGGRITNFSQEFRLVSPAGQMFEYVAGLYYFRSGQTSNNTQQGAVLQALLPTGRTLGQVSITNVEAKSYAAFAQGTLHLGDAFRLIAGGRLNREEISADTDRFLAPGALAPFGSILPVAGSVSDNDFSYRLGAQYDLTPDVMGYLTYSRGYKGPAVNDGAASQNVPLIVRPEIPKQIEAGIKSDLLEHRLALNLAVFHTQVSDFQAQFFDPASMQFIYGNAPELTTKGVEITLFGRPIDGLSLNGGLAYTDATYGEGFFTVCGPNQTAAQGCVGGRQSAVGRRLSATPRWKMTFSGEYVHAWENGYEGYVQLDGVYSSSVVFTQFPDAEATTGAHLVLGGRVGVRSPEGRYGLAIYARNLTDAQVPGFITTNPLGVQLGDPASHIQFLGPDYRRVVGVSLDARF